MNKCAFNVKDAGLCEENIVKVSNIQDKTVNGDVNVYDIRYGQHSLKAYAMPKKLVLTCSHKYVLDDYVKLLNVESWGNKAIFSGRKWEEYA